jgi:hypothetical protein
LRDGLAIRNRPAKADRGNAGWQRELSVSYAKLADAYWKTGKKPMALDALRRRGRIMIRRYESLRWRVTPSASTHLGCVFGLSALST